jgi:hypothetical protein
VDEQATHYQRLEDLKHSLAIGAIFKDEFEYILEWLAWHQMAGFNDFYIADNASTDGTRELLEALSEIKQLNIIYQPTRENIAGVINNQTAAYDRISQLFLGNVEGILFIDADEFLIHESMIDGAEYKLLHDLFGDPKIAMVGINWRTFGSSGQKTWESGLVIERFNEYFKAARNHKPLVTHNRLKSISRIKFTRGISVHVSDFCEDALCVDPLGNAIEFVSVNNTPVKISSLSKHVCESPLRINHYVIKSWEEFVTKKQKRGRADISARRSDSFFEEHDFNGAQFKFHKKKIERLKAKIQELNNALDSTSFNRRLTGFIDVNNKNKISGWLVNEQGKSKDLKVNIFVNSVYQGFAKVGFYRHDLKEKKISIDGFSGFRWTHAQTLKNGDKVEVYVHANRYKFPKNASIEIGLNI